MTVRVERTRERVSSVRLERVAGRLLDASTLCALATVTPRGRAYINTMYFARSGWDLVWLSAPGSAHSCHVRANGSAAIAVYDSRQRWGGPSDRGIQVFGRAREVSARAARDAIAEYERRFRNEPRILGRFVAYRLRTTRLKLFDESEFGAGTFVTARVRRDGRLEWERTERYRD